MLRGIIDWRSGISGMTETDYWVVSLGLTTLMPGGAVVVVWAELLSGLLPTKVCKAEAAEACMAASGESPPALSAATLWSRLKTAIKILNRWGRIVWWELMGP